MTLSWIISFLKCSGINSKHIVIEALEEATIDDLIELRRSISEEINKKVSL